jgi:hypothetical protein
VRQLDIRDHISSRLVMPPLPFIIGGVNRLLRDIELRQRAVLHDIFFFSAPNEHGWERSWWVRYKKLGDDQVYFQPVLVQDILTASPGSNQTYTSNAGWNNNINSVEGIGGGATGGGNGSSGGTSSRSGGGGGAYSRINNFSFTTPGTTTATYQIGIGGAAVDGTVTTGNFNGNAGGQTWFNGTTYAGSSMGADNGRGGTFIVSGAGTANGGAGGAIANNIPASQGFAGGRGGNATSDGTSTFPSSGGGGAGGKRAAGGQGVDISTNSASAGGQGDGTFGGAGSAGALFNDASNHRSAAGGSGTEWDATHGSGGGSGGGLNIGVGNCGSGAAGLYGGGSGGGATAGSISDSSVGAGGQGIIVLSWAYPVFSDADFGNRHALSRIMRAEPYW